MRLQQTIAKFCYSKNEKEKNVSRRNCSEKIDYSDIIPYLHSAGQHYLRPSRPADHAAAVRPT